MKRTKILYKKKQSKIKTIEGETPLKALHFSFSSDLAERFSSSVKLNRCIHLIYLVSISI